MDQTSTTALRRSASPESTERRAKRVKVASPAETDSDTPAAAAAATVARESVIVNKASSSRENHAKPAVVLKPPSNSVPLASTPLPVLLVAETALLPLSEEETEEVIVRNRELARWTPDATATLPRHVPSVLSDDAIIRRKLMFEAGNPPVSSHRGVKLLSGVIGSLVRNVQDLRPEEEIEAVAQRVQLFLHQEELTLTRLGVACDSVAKIAEQEASAPLILQTALKDVQQQMEEQKRRLEEASKTDQLFAGYVESANRIRKLESYDELVKTRNKLKEETKKLKEEKSRLDRQQEEKLPYLVVANWALKNLRYGEGGQAISSVIADGAVQHHPKSTNKHKKSPKKSSKESKN